MPLDRTIDVTVPHTLPQATAWERVLRWLGDSKAKAVESTERGTVINPLNIALDFVAHKIRLELEVLGKIVKVTIDVTPNVVELHSEAIEGRWIEMVVISGSVLFSESRIYSQLVERLKP